MEVDQRYQITRKVTLVGALVNCLLASLQILFGIVGKSQALLADGIHTLSDLSTDFIVLFASSRAAKKADEDHPYGHGRIETLASVILGCVLILVGIGIGLRGLQSIYSAKQANPEVITIAFALLAIVSKEGLYQYTIRAARRLHSNLLESNARHHRSDVFSSIVVLIGISAQLMGIPYMDAVAAVVVACLISLMGYKTSRKALSELIDTALEPELIGRISESMKSSDSVEAVHSLRSRSMGGLGYIDSEILVSPHLTVSEAHHIAYQLEESIKQDFPQIIDVQIHVDPLSESGHDRVLDLPGRSQVESDLELAWQALPQLHQPTQIQLHYLSHGIEIDLVFQLDTDNPAQQTQAQQLKSLARQIDYVGKVNIYFSA